MKIFFDSSAFAKRYIVDQQSDEIDEHCAKATSLAVSVICLPEIISALARLKREVKITSQQFHKAKKALLSDLSDADICGLNQNVIHQTIEALEKVPLKAMDAIHVACALEWEAELFVTSDQQQYKGAKKLKLNAIFIK